MKLPESERSQRVAMLLKALDRLATRPMTFMEVCGTHTVSVFRNGIRSLIPPNLHLLSGPGCPVCVTDQGDIDAIIDLSQQKNVIVATYGDMMRVPGTFSSLGKQKAEGRDIRVITSAASCLDIALGNPSKEVVFLAIGFETTSPATASLLIEARENNIDNLSITCFHKRTPPVLEQLARDESLKIDGFLLPGHVSVILGYEPYRFLADRYGISCTIAGFEAEDILLGLVDLASQLSRNKPHLDSTYQRAVRPWGNRVARQLLETVFEYDNASWRGIGEIPDSGLKLRETFKGYNAIEKFRIKVKKVQPPQGCLCGEVLSGRITPPSCPLFAKKCTPSTPVGPCMVSGEGTCSAYYKFSRGGTISWGN